jgi:hypothetical protein
MYLQSFLLLPTLAASVLANYRVEGTTYGVDSDLIAVPLALGGRVSNDIYTRCQELDEKGEQISTGEECVWNGLQYMIQALSDAHNAFQAVALLSNTISGVERTPTLPVPQLWPPLLLWTLLNLISDWHRRN